MTTKPTSDAQRKASLKYRKANLLKMEINRELATKLREWGDKNKCKSWNEILNALLDTSSQIERKP